MRNPAKKRVLGVFSLAMMGIAAIFSLRNLPIAAMYGFSSITYYVAAALLFFIPSALICSKLSATFPEAGGLYLWVKKALSPSFGFLAIWLEWINTVCSFPMMLGFILFTLLYPLAPMLANNRLDEFSFMTITFWAITALNFFGIKTSSRFSSVGVLLGTLLIALLIIALAATWIIQGHMSQITFSWHALIPTFQFGTLAFLITMINSISGIQLIAFLSEETENPKRTFPRATLIIVSVILSLSMLGALAIAIVTPASSSSLIGGIVEALMTFLTPFHLGWLVPTLVIFVGLGVLAEINAWVIGPSKGMLAAAEAGQLPKLFALKNKRGVPTTILLAQGIIATLLAGAYIYMPSVNSAYWLLSDLTAEFTLMMWLLLFVSAIVLCVRLNEKDRWQYILAASIGIVTCLVVLGFSYIPPSNVIKAGSIFKYETVLIGGLILFSILPLIKTALNHRKAKAN